MQYEEVEKMTDATVGRLIKAVEDISKEKRVTGPCDNGHLTIMRFTTCWKAMFGTPNLDSGDGRAEVRDLEKFPTIEEALINLLIDELEAREIEMVM